MGRPLGVDLTGKRFGKLVVLSAVQVPTGNNHYRTRWKCLCDCGKEKLIDGSALTTEKTRSCNGCFKDMVEVGQQFGKLTVLEDVKVVEKNGTRSMWQCRCECGNEIKVRGTILLKGKRKSCGKCLKSQDLKGRKFGRLIVLHSSKEDGYWGCKCDCGTPAKVHYLNLLRGMTKSCGCLSRELIEERNRKNATHQ